MLGVSAEFVLSVVGAGLVAGGVVAGVFDGIGDDVLLSDEPFVLWLLASDPVVVPTVALSEPPVEDESVLCANAGSSGATVKTPITKRAARLKAALSEMMVVIPFHGFHPRRSIMREIGFDLSP